MSIWTSMGVSMAFLCSSASALMATDWFVDAANCPGGSGTESDPFCAIVQGPAKQS